MNLKGTWRVSNSIQIPPKLWIPICLVWFYTVFNHTVATIHNQFVSEFIDQTSVFKVLASELDWVHVSYELHNTVNLCYRSTFGKKWWINPPSQTIGSTLCPAWRHLWTEFPLGLWHYEEMNSPCYGQLEKCEGKMGWFKLSKQTNSWIKTPRSLHH